MHGFFDREDIAPFLRKAPQRSAQSIAAPPRDSPTPPSHMLRPRRLGAHFRCMIPLWGSALDPNVILINSRQSGPSETHEFTQGIGTYSIETDILINSS